MNQDIKRQWVTALRSGEYAQTRGNLRDQNGFCALGVLCDVYASQGGGPRDWHWGGWDSKNSCFPFEGQGLRRRVTVPKPVLDEICLSRSSRHFVTALNDGGRIPFTEIADWIEVNL
jgi:hypothetical protein